MALLKKLKSLLGLDGGSSSDRQGTDTVGVTVEHDPDTTEEPAPGTDTESDGAPPGTPAPGSGQAKPEPVEREAADEVEGTDGDAEPETGRSDVDPGVESPEPGSEPPEAAEPSDETDPNLGASGPEPEPGDEEVEAVEGGPRGSEQRATGESLQDIKGIGPSYADRLADTGVETVDQLAAADADELADETGLSEKRIQGWIERASAR